MSDVRGTIRTVISLDGDDVIDETVFNQEPLVMMISKAFMIEIVGISTKHRVDVSLTFDPPLGTAW